MDCQVAKNTHKTVQHKSKDKAKP